MKKMNPQKMDKQHRSPEHIEKFLKHLGRYWEHHPDSRLGMILITLSKNTGKDLFLIDDELWISLIDEMLEKEKLLK